MKKLHNDKIKTHVSAALSGEDLKHIESVEARGFDNEDKSCFLTVEKLPEGDKPVDNVRRIGVFTDVVLDMYDIKKLIKDGVLMVGDDYEVIH